MNTFEQFLFEKLTPRELIKKYDNDESDELTKTYIILLKKELEILSQKPTVKILDGLIKKHGINHFMPPPIAFEKHSEHDSLFYLLLCGADYFSNHDTNLMRKITDFVLLR